MSQTQAMETQPEVIDMHVHLWQHSVRNDEQVLRAMLDRYPIAWLGILPLWGGHHPSVAEIRAGNAAAAFCRTDPKRLKQFVTVNPRHANSCEEIRRGCIEDGAVAVKVWVATLADDSLSDPLARASVCASTFRFCFTRFTKPSANSRTKPMPNTSRRWRGVFPI